MHCRWSFPFSFRGQKPVPYALNPPRPKLWDKGGHEQQPLYPHHQFGISDFSVNRWEFYGTDIGGGSLSWVWRGTCLTALSFIDFRLSYDVCKDTVWSSVSNRPSRMKWYGCSFHSGGPELQLFPVENIFQAPSSVKRRGPMEDTDMRCRA